MRVLDARGTNAQLTLTGVTVTRVSFRAKGRHRNGHTRPSATQLVARALGMASADGHIDDELDDVEFDAAWDDLLFDGGSPSRSSPEKDVTPPKPTTDAAVQRNKTLFQGDLMQSTAIATAPHDHKRAESDSEVRGGVNLEPVQPLGHDSASMTTKVVGKNNTNGNERGNRVMDQRDEPRAVEGVDREDRIRDATPLRDHMAANDEPTTRTTTQLVKGSGTLTTTAAGNRLRAETQGTYTPNALVAGDDGREQVDPRGPQRKRLFAHAVAASSRPTDPDRVDGDGGSDVTKERRPNNDRHDTAVIKMDWSESANRRPVLDTTMKRTNDEAVDMTTSHHDDVDDDDMMWLTQPKRGGTPPNGLLLGPTTAQQSVVDVQRGTVDPVDRLELPHDGLQDDFAASRRQVEPPSSNRPFHEVVDEPAHASKNSRRPQPSTGDTTLAGARKGVRTDQSNAILRGKSDDVDGRRDNEEGQATRSVDAMKQLPSFMTRPPEPSLVNATNSTEGTKNEPSSLHRVTSTADDLIALFGPGESRLPGDEDMWVESSNVNSFQTGRLPPSTTTWTTATTTALPTTRNEPHEMPPSKHKLSGSPSVALPLVRVPPSILASEGSLDPPPAPPQSFNMTIVGTPTAVTMVDSSRSMVKGKLTAMTTPHESPGMTATASRSSKSATHLPQIVVATGNDVLARPSQLLTKQQLWPSLVAADSDDDAWKQLVQDEALILSMRHSVEEDSRRGSNSSSMLDTDDAQPSRRTTRRTKRKSFDQHVAVAGNPSLSLERRNDDGDDDGSSSMTIQPHKKALAESQRQDLWHTLRKGSMTKQLPSPTTRPVAVTAPAAATNMLYTLDQKLASFETYLGENAALKTELDQVKVANDGMAGQLAELQRLVQQHEDTIERMQRDATTAAAAAATAHATALEQTIAAHATQQSAWHEFVFRQRTTRDRRQWLTQVWHGWRLAIADQRQQRIAAASAVAAVIHRRDATQHKLRHALHRLQNASALQVGTHEAVQARLMVQEYQRHTRATAVHCAMLLVTRSWRDHKQHAVRRA
ncbi:hypothetical protein As57867_020907, partial [Aphanomyces stellatus]